MKKSIESYLQSLIDCVNSSDDIDALWLYGSHAKKSAGPESDIDLAVLFSCYDTNPLERRVRPELLAIEWQQQLNLKDGDISVLDLEIAPVPLAMSVLQTGKLLVNKNRSHEFRVSQEIMSKWEIDYQYHYKNYG